MSAWSHGATNSGVTLRKLCCKVILSDNHALAGKPQGRVFYVAYSCITRPWEEELLLSLCCIQLVTNAIHLIIQEESFLKSIFRVSCNALRMYPGLVWQQNCTLLSRYLKRERPRVCDSVVSQGRAHPTHTPSIPHLALKQRMLLPKRSSPSAHWSIMDIKWMVLGGPRLAMKVLFEGI